MHEIGHVLGISSDSLAYFRHPITGQSLTPRPFEVSTVTCVNGDKIQYLGMPSSEVLQERVVSATTANGGGGGGGKLRYYEVVTPTVQQVVQNQFNCPTLLGARLENQQDGTDCFGSHWDERLYYTEIMGAVFSKSMNALSPLTLAYLESSGWYRVNYESRYVQPSTFGHGAGCDFITGQCIDSSNNGTISETFTEMFCNSPTTIKDQRVDVESSGPQTCDPSHTMKTYCDLINTNEMNSIGNTAAAGGLDEPPIEYQYFEGQPELRPYTLLMADYCPVPQLEGHSCFEYDGRDRITNEMEAVGETYGPNSRCIETDGTTRSYSLCLETVCNDELGVVQLYVANELRTCEYDGQIFTNVYDNVSIKCPKAALICPSLFCPSNCSGRGKCIYASDGGPNGNAMIANGRLARCICDSDDDTTRGCYNTPMNLPPEYGITAKNPNKANKTVFLAIIGSLIGGLSIMFVSVRYYKSKKNVFM
jgi:leishmanolysin-like peptidase